MPPARVPLPGSDDGWPSPDARFEPVVDDAIDLDQLELRADPHAWADLTELERFAVGYRYGFGGPTHTMKDLAGELGCCHSEARDVLGSALDKLRQRLSAS
jgi:DNA-directed RNA polymerase sigma subunit (sigma70/sigma32)